MVFLKIILDFGLNGQAVGNKCWWFLQLVKSLLSIVFANFLKLNFPSLPVQYSGKEKDNPNCKKFQMVVTFNSNPNHYKLNERRVQNQIITDLNDIRIWIWP